MDRAPKVGVISLSDAKKVIERARYAALVLSTFDRMEREDCADDRREFREKKTAVERKARRAF